MLLRLRLRLRLRLWPPPPLLLWLRGRAEPEEEEAAAVMGWQYSRFSTMCVSIRRGTGAVGPVVAATKRAVSVSVESPPK